MIKVALSLLPSFIIIIIDASLALFFLQESRKVHNYKSLFFWLGIAQLLSVLIWLKYIIIMILVYSGLSFNNPLIKIGSLRNIGNVMETLFLIFQLVALASVSLIKQGSGKSD